jgi:cytochrome c oxidase subunit 1
MSNDEQSPMSQGSQLSQQSQASQQSQMSRPKADASDAQLLGVRQAALGAAAGLAGMAAMAPFLALAWALGAFELSAVAGLSDIVALGPSFLYGTIIFVGGGMTTLPLLFVSLAVFLPGEEVRVKGAVFGAIVWTGFAVAFWTGQAGASLALFLVLTLVAHVAYGAVLGTVYARYARIPVYDV